MDIDKKININKNVIIVVGILFVFIIIILSLGEKNNSIKCTLNENNNSGNFETTITANFKNDKLDNFIYEFKNTPSTNFLDMIDSIYDNYNSQLSELKKNGGYNYELEKGSNYVYFKSDINFNKIPETTEALVKFNNEWSFKDFKENLENAGFTCN